MGWTTITYRNTHEQFRDSDLWLLREFFLRASESLAPPLPPTDARVLRSFFEHWDWLCPGVFIGAEFDAFVAEDHHRWALLFRVLQRAGDLVADFGDFLPRSQLQAIGSARGCHYTQDLPSRPILETIGRLCTLLSRHEPATGETKSNA